MSRIEKLFSGIFLSLLSLILTLILIELVAQYYLWNIADEQQFNLYASVNQFTERYDDSSIRFIPHHYLPYVPNPNYEAASNKHNSLGFRGDEVTLEKPDGVYRIVTIGGSTTYSSGVARYDRSYPYRLQQVFHNSDYTNIEVINAGVPGYTSHESLINLQFRVLPLDPDLIIVYHATNDAHARLITPPSEYRADNSGYRSPIASSVFMPNIFEYSTAFRIIAIQLGLMKTHNSLENIQSRHPESSVAEEFFDLWEDGIQTNVFDEYSVMDLIEANPPIYFESDLRSIIGIAQAHDIDVMLTTWAYSPEFIDEARASSEEYKLMYQQHNDLIRSIGASEDIYFYDFVNDMPTEKKYFTDGRHMSRDGNGLRARLFAEFIINNIFDKKES